MKLFEEYKLYESMWEDTSFKEASVVSKETDQLCSVLFDGRQMFTGTKKECEDWVKSNSGRFDNRLAIKDNATVNVVESDAKTSVKHTRKSISEDVAAEYDEAEVKGTSWDNLITQADNFLDAIIKATGNENYDDGDGYWETEGTTWCNRYLYYSNSLNNTSLVKDLCDLGSSKIPNANFYYTEDDMEEEPVSEIGYTLTKATVAESGCKGADCKKDLKEEAGYRVVLADYDTDDFDINVEFGMQDPEENEVVDYEYLLKPGQTAGDLVVWLSRDCGYTSIYVHDERPATDADIKRLASQTFPVTGTGEEWQDYGTIAEAADLESNKNIIAEAQAAKYKVLYSDCHTEIVDEDTMNQLVDELESSTRDDVSQIRRISSSGKLGKAIWTEEEGLL